MTRRRAAGLMVLVTLLWSLAGVVTRQLESTRSFEVTFWRSAFNACALFVLLSLPRGPRAIALSIRRGGRLVWLSGTAWAVMFTAFMLALTLTTVANVLVTMAVAPLASALLARFALREAVPLRTVAAALAAGLGITWMLSGGFDGGDADDLTGTLIALCVPLAAAANWTLVQHASRAGAAGDALDMRPAILIGACLSAAATLSFALPFEASAHDLALLAFLGVVQLALPCLLAVAVAGVLSAPEVALLSLLEVVLGVAWAWLGADERPPSSVLGGGAIVVAALVVNETLALRGGGPARAR